MVGGAERTSTVRFVLMLHHCTDSLRRCLLPPSVVLSLSSPAWGCSEAGCAWRAARHRPRRRPAERSQRLKVRSLRWPAVNASRNAARHIDQTVGASAARRGIPWLPVSAARPASNDPPKARSTSMSQRQPSSTGSPGSARRSRLESWPTGTHSARSDRSPNWIVCAASGQLSVSVSSRSCASLAYLDRALPAP